VLHLFRGPDSYSRGEALATLRAGLNGDGMLEANTTAFDGRSVTPAELIAACDTVPFLAERRLVLVDGLLGAQHSAQRGGKRGRTSGKPGSSAGSSPWAELPAYVQRLPDSTELVLIDGELREDNWLLAALRPLARDYAFALLRGEELRGWIQRRLTERKATIAPRALAVLAESVGSQLWQMTSEIEKLSLYAGERPIEVADVHALVTVTRTTTVFQLVDALMEGRSGDALRLVREQLDGGAAGPYLLTMIARQFRQLLLLRDMQRRGVPRQEMARRLAIRPEHVLGRLLELARRHSDEHLQAAYERLLQADLQIKRGIQDEDTALELLVAELAGFGRRPVSVR
jgi:DNA polymerase-3 subunit delta